MTVHRNGILTSTDLPYSLEPAEGYNEYKMTSILRDHLSMLMQYADSKEIIDQILGLVNGYTGQLINLKTINRLETIKEVYKAVDGFFDKAPDDNKKEIQCKAGCTACCHIELEVSEDEAALMIQYCQDNGIGIDLEYLTKQSATGRKTFSELSRCVFLKDNLCSIYPVRPIACRKHWVRSDPALCDSSLDIIREVDRYFDINSEILSSALLNVRSTAPIEVALLNELNKTH
jgi:hypothetical protein